MRFIVFETINNKKDHNPFENQNLKFEIIDELESKSII